MIILEEAPNDIALTHAAFESEAEANLVDLLRADGDVILSLVAVEDGRIEGHILFTKLSVITTECTR